MRHARRPKPHGAGGSSSPAMSFHFRLRLWLLTCTNCAIILLWEGIVVKGPVSRYLARRRGEAATKLEAERRLLKSAGV